MPVWKYIANRLLTFVENILMGAKLSEYHTGYRAFSRELLERLPLEENSDDFVFDNQMLAQILWFDFTVAEVSCPTKYFPEASSINMGEYKIWARMFNDSPVVSTCQNEDNNLKVFPQLQLALYFHNQHRNFETMAV